MRWSLVLSALIAFQSALSFVCVALPIAPQSDELERRSLSRKLKLPSKKYRENAKDHPFAYHVDGLDAEGKPTDQSTVRKETLKTAKARSEHATEVLSSHSKEHQIHADHVFEVQMLKHHLQEHGVKFGDMNPQLQKKVKGILNGKNNMAFIPGPINISKGQMIKNGMHKEKTTGDFEKARNEYALRSYRTAHKTARQLDRALKKHPGYTEAVTKEGHTHTLKEKLHNTFVDAGLHPPPVGHRSSGSSSSSSGSSSVKNHSKKSSSKQSSPRPSTPGPSSRRSTKRKASPGSPPKSPPKNGNRNGNRNGKKKGRQN